MRKLLFIVNPISGDLDKSRINRQIDRFCESEKVEWRRLETTGEGDLERIEAALDEWRPDTAVAAGGDGTVNLVGRALLGRSVRLGILPLGSGNGLATDLGLPDGLDACLRILLRGPARRLDVLHINDTHYSFHLADLGFNAKLIQDFEAEPRRGKFAYVRHFFRNLHYKPKVRYHLQFPDRELHIRAAMVTFANARRYGTGAIVNPVGRPDDGRFEVCIFKPWPWWYMGWMALLFFTGRLDQSDYVRIRSTREVTLRSSAPQPMQVDGEVVGEREEVRVVIREGAVEVVVGDE